MCARACLHREFLCLGQGLGALGRPGVQGGLGAGVPLFDVAQRLFFTAGTGVFGVFGGGPLPLLCAQCAAVVNVTAGIIAAGVIFEVIEVCVETRVRCRRSPRAGCHLSGNPPCALLVHAEKFKFKMFIFVQ